tara:strand:+ start:69 stop:1070 length:1002 start_codon:yes stop_codon:yes gene_type:complete
MPVDFSSVPKRTILHVLCILFVTMVHSDVRAQESPAPIRTIEDLRQPRPTPSERSKQWRVRIKEIVREHFAAGRSPEVRLRGLDALRQLTDPAAFQPMLEVLNSEQDDVRLMMLEHFLANGDAGQAALAWAAVYSRDNALRYEATLRIRRPACRSVLAVIDGSLRSRNEDVIANAAILANALDVFEAIPLLIYAQSVPEDTSNTGAGTGGGGNAWIATGQQMAYIADLVPVVGNGVAAYRPIIGTITEGSVFQVDDVVVTIYRRQVHVALVSLSSRDWGQSTESLGYDRRRWWAWNDRTYQPYRAERDRLAREEAEIEALAEKIRRERESRTR